MKKILIVLGITFLIGLSVFGYLYLQTENEEGNLQYIETKTGEQILLPKSWNFTTNEEAGKALKIKNDKNIKPIFFATEKKKNSDVFYYVIKENLNSKITKQELKSLLKTTVNSEKINDPNLEVIETGVIDNKSNNKNNGQFIIYKTKNIHKFIAYFYPRPKELITFTSYLNNKEYENNIPLIKYIALKNKY